MRKSSIIICVFGVLAVAGCASNNELMSANDVPKSAMSALRNAEHYELLSLNPTWSRNSPPDGFHGYAVLGRASVSNADTRKRLTHALRKGALENWGLAAGCFKPRHGIHVTQANQSTDFVICFECLQAVVFTDAQPSQSFLVSRSPERIFDEVLRKAGIPLAEK